MRGLLIANKDLQARNKLAGLFNEADYRIVTTDSVANALEGIINKEIQVVVLDGQYDEQNVTKLIPLLKKCNRNISIILITDDIPINLIRKIRQEGIFYHALRSATGDHFEEVCAVVRCAFKKYDERTRTVYGTGKEKSMFPIKSLFSTLTLMLLVVAPAFAVDTTISYNSGLLVLLFVGFCALLIVVQLVPAVLALFGLTKSAGESLAEKKKSAVQIKHR